jgi:CRP-like cAMP-binding protein
MDAIITFFNRLSPLSVETLALIREVFTFGELKKDEFFIQEGDYAKEIAFLETGIVRAFYTDKKGKEYNQYFFVAPSIIGAYSSLITKEKNRIPQQALTDCRIWKARFNRIEKLSETNFEIERLRRAVAEKYFIEFERKQIEMALLDASERYQIFQREFPEVERQIPQHQVASYLGITPTQLSRVKRSLYEEKRNALRGARAKSAD